MVSGSTSLEPQHLESREGWISEFQVCLICIVSSRIARAAAIQRSPISKKASVCVCVCVCDILI
ncbi:mCG1039874 [Mus musculus]|nr:mCG1039874 [Mus musculus]